MAFPSSTGSKGMDKHEAWVGSRNVAAAVKQASQNVRSLSASGSLASSNLLDYVTYLADARAQLATYALVPGIATYGQEQLEDPTMNLTQEFVTMRDQIDATRTWITANFPKNAQGFLLAQTFTTDGSGRQADRVFTAAETAGLRTVLDALIATID